MLKTAEASTDGFLEKERLCMSQFFLGTSSPSLKPLNGMQRVKLGQVKVKVMGAYMGNNWVRKQLVSLQRLKSCRQCLLFRSHMWDLRIVWSTISAQILFWGTC